MQTSTGLLILGLAIFAAYFYLFAKHISTLSPEQKNLFTKKSKPGAKVNGITLVPAYLAVIYFNNFYVTLGILCYLVIAIFILSDINKKSLRKLGFAEEFILRLKKISCVGGVAGVLFAAAVLLIQKPDGM